MKIYVYMEKIAHQHKKDEMRAFSRKEDALEFLCFRMQDELYCTWEDAKKNISAGETVKEDYVRLLNKDGKENIFEVRECEFENDSEPQDS